jgi:GNAT superfamily N-acetyltransferase
MLKAEGRVVAERSDRTAVSRELWKGLVSFNREQAGPLRYTRTVLSVRDSRGRLLGGLILQSYWRESYVELLWLSARARLAGFGSRLIKEAERRARRRGSRLIHLNTLFLQAPGYEKHGYQRFGGMSGSPRGEPAFLRETPHAGQSSATMTAPSTKNLAAYRRRQSQVRCAQVRQRVEDSMDPEKIKVRVATGRTLDVVVYSKRADRMRSCSAKASDQVRPDPTRMGLSYAGSVRGGAV